MNDKDDHILSQVLCQTPYSYPSLSPSCTRPKNHTGNHIVSIEWSSSKKCNESMWTINGLFTCHLLENHVGAHSGESVSSYIIPNCYSRGKE